MLKFDKPEEAIQYRQSAFVLIKNHFGSLGAMANGRAPFDATVAKENGAVLETLAALPWQAFGPGTEGGKAKADVWKEKAQFDTHAGNFVTAASKLVAATKTGDIAQIKATFGPAAQTCKACHDDFRGR